jgi:CelD/BcsL family acetyltransferase involved in cellulose biosynthesis
VLDARFPTHGSSALRPASPAAGPEITVTWLRTVAELQAIEPAWRDLETSVRHRTPLSTFDYNIAWYRHYGGGFGGDPLVGVARRGSALVGVAPLVVRRRRVGRIPLTSVEFAAHEAYAGEFLVPDDRPHHAAFFLDALVRDVRFDVICLNDIDLRTARYGSLRDAIARGRLRVETSNHPNAMVDLSRGYDAYLRGRTAHFRHAVRRHGRRIEEAGPGAVEGVVLWRGVETLEETLARMIAITEASHKLNGARLADIHRGFLSEIGRRFAPRGELALPILTIGGRDAAFVMGMVERSCFYDITLSYDEAFAAFRPGTHLIQQLLHELADAGVHTFISHGAHEYKEHWASAFVPGTRLFLFAPGFRPTATRFVRFSLAPVWRRFGAGEP